MNLYVLCYEFRNTCFTYFRTTFKRKVHVHVKDEWLLENVKFCRGRYVPNCLHFGSFLTENFWASLRANEASVIAHNKFLLRLRFFKTIIKAENIPIMKRAWIFIG